MCLCNMNSLVIADSIYYFGIRFQVLDMLRVGVVMNLMSVAAVALTVSTVGVEVFGLDKYPNWAGTNQTSN